jgi:uncharacterized protein (UPF0333 family)
MQKSKQVLIIVGIVLLVAIIIAGWYFYKNKRGIIIGEDGSKIKYSTDGKTTTVKNEEGTFAVGEDVKIPSDFPKNMPVYSDIKLEMAWSGSSKENDPESENIKAGYAGTIARSCEETFEWYKTELTKLGWKIDASLKEGMTLSNAKEICSFTTNKNGNNCDITLTIMDKTEITNTTSDGEDEYSTMVKESKDMEELQKQMDEGGIKY